VSAEPQSGHLTRRTVRLDGLADAERPAARAGREERSRTRAACRDPPRTSSRWSRRGRAGSAPSRRTLASGDVLDVSTDGVHGRAPGVGRGDQHGHRPAMLVDLNLAQDAEVLDRDDRDLGSGWRRWQLAALVQRPLRCRHHVAPGCERAMCCISASRCPWGGSGCPSAARERQVESAGKGQRGLRHHLRDWSRRRPTRRTAACPRLPQQLRR
jgi:hypothetical protein